MLASASIKDYIMDLKYNSDPDVVKSIANSIAKIQKDDRVSQKGISPEERRNIQIENSMLSGYNMPALYNAMKKGFVEDGQFIENGGADEYGKGAKELVDAYARMYANQDISPFEKIDNFLKAHTQYLTLRSEPQEEEQQEIMQSMMTFDDEDDLDSGFFDEDRDVEQSQFAQLLQWLDDMKKSSSEEKKFSQIEKISDLQKVAVSEFARPRPLFIKKLINKDFWIRKTVPLKRNLYTIVDRSGSMQEFVDKRNEALKFIFDTCIGKDIKMFHTSFYTHLNNDEMEISGEDELKKISRISPDGPDNLGNATIEKLNKITRKPEKQYLIVMSDGTGSFNDAKQSDLANSLAISKNVEIKYVLFSHQNDMHTIKKEDIFYIFDGDDDDWCEDDDD